MLWVLLLALAVTPSQQAPTYGYQLGKGFYRAMFQGMSFCSTRPGGREQQCCLNRDDQCTVSHVRFRGTVCYCDQYCDRAQPDCCPDYLDHCVGPRKCNSYQFECTRQFQCIDAYRKCDGNVDCQDQSDEDEQSCPHRDPDKGEIISSLVPDVVHLAEYPLHITKREFTCKFEVKHHSHQLRLEMYTDPRTEDPLVTQDQAGNPEYRTSNELRGELTIRPDIEAVVCKAYDHEGDLKFYYRSPIKKSKKGIGLPPPDYAKCVTVVNTTPYSVVATVTYQDEHGHTRERQRTVNRSKQYTFKQVLHASPGATYHTAIPVRRLKVSAVQSGFNEVEVPVQVSGVHDCVERKVLLDSSSGRLYITE